MDGLKLYFRCSAGESRLAVNLIMQALKEFGVRAGEFYNIHSLVCETLAAPCLGLLLACSLVRANATRDSKPFRRANLDRINATTAEGKAGDCKTQENDGTILTYEPPETCGAQGRTP
jgi:hypothetical protein